MSLSPGRFITLEGGEGSGKSTQARRLADLLRARGLDVVLTREPGGSPGAEMARAALLSGAIKPFGVEAEAIVFAAARLDHVEETIRPALAAGKWVICDRFTDSTRVYQGAVGQVSPGLLRALEDVAAAHARPDLTLILDLPPKTGLSRASARANGAAADRFEGEGLSFHTAVRAAFLDIAKAEPERCVLIDAGGDVDEVARRIAQAVSARLPLPEGVAA